MCRSLVRVGIALARFRATDDRPMRLGRLPLPGRTAAAGSAELQVVDRGTYGVTHFGRTRAAMHHRLAGGSTMIVLIVVALLVSRAGLAVRFVHEARATIATAPSHAGRRIDRAHEAPRAPARTSHTAALRVSGPAITRVHAPGAAADGPRGTGAAHASGWSLGWLAPRAPGVTVETCALRVAPPGQPAPASRAPPLG